MDKIELKTVEEKMRKAIDTQFKGWDHEEKVRCPSLSKMAQFINAKFPNLTATIHTWHASTKNRKIGQLKSLEYRKHVGKLLRVENSNKNIIFEHNSTETYRSNIDVAEYIFKLKRGLRRWNGKKRHMDITI